MERLLRLQPRQFRFPGYDALLLWLLVAVAHGKDSYPVAGFGGHKTENLL